MTRRGTGKRTGQRPVRSHPYVKTSGTARPEPIRMDDAETGKPLTQNMREGVDEWVGSNTKSRKLYLKTGRTNKQRKLQKRKHGSRASRKFPKMKACNTKIGKGKGKGKRGKPKAQQQC